jgi:hypothetical protein
MRSACRWPPPSRRVPLSVRGFGHVKLANLALARSREAELLHRWDPARHPRPRPSPPPVSSRALPWSRADGGPQR